MFKRFVISQASMTPVLLPGDQIFAIRGRTTNRGNIVVVRRPEGAYLIKRVIGLAGETVHATGGVVHINGDPNLDPWGVGLTGPSKPVTIPAGHVWLLGDRREVSTSDSRSFGPVVLDKWWKPALRYWPIGRFGRVG